MYTREQMVSLALKFKGATKGSARHRQLVDAFNKVKPNGEVANYSCPWCAITVTALAIMGGYKPSNYPMSYNCGTIISKAKALGMWQERDSYVPKIGDLVLYDWHDTGRGDNVGTPDHIGMVVSVGNSSFKVLEGNMSTTSMVGIRSVRINGRYIRGFIVPNYSTSLQLGSKGKTVETWQKKLNAVGFSLKVDGEFGVKTDEATKQFQKAHGLKQTGIVGTKTRKAMHNALNLRARRMAVYYGRTLVEKKAKYLKWTPDVLSHKCTIDNKDARRKYGLAFNCIAFVGACWHHGAKVLKYCGGASVGNDAWFNKLRKSKDPLAFWKSRHGSKWTMTTIGKAKAGDIIIGYKNGKYKHTMMKSFNGKILDCTSSGGARERKMLKGYRCLVFHYTGEGSY